MINNNIYVMIGANCVKIAVVVRRIIQTCYWAPKSLIFASLRSHHTWPRAKIN